MTTKRRVDFINDPIGPSLRRFAVPLAFSFIVNMVYSLIDRFYVSRLGDAAIAAIGSSDQIVFLLFTLVSGFAVGSGIIVARRFGEGDRVGASRTGTQALVGMAITSASVTAVMYLLLPVIPLIMQMDAEVETLSVEYLSMLLIGFTFNLMNFQMFSIVRSTGNAVFPMTVLIITVILNAIIAPFLIFGIGPFPELGMRGAGLATAISQMSGTGIALTALIRGSTNIHLDFTQFRLDGELLRRVAKQGFPASLQMLSVSLNRAAIFAIVAGFGTHVTAAYTLGLNIDMMVYMSVFAMGIAVETATGQNLGAEQPERVRAIHRSAVRQIGLLMLILAAAVWAFGTEFVELYSRNPATVTEATLYLSFTVIGYVFFSTGLLTVRVLSGAGAAMLAMSITAGSLLGIQLPLAFVLGYYTSLGPIGVWVAVLFGYVAFTIIALLVFRSNRWKTVRV
jgi:putative MATE family efflux protein